MLLLAAIFVAGVLHGLGPDHLAAISAMGAAGGQSARRVVFFSTRFALGHAVVIAAAGLLGKFGRALLPPVWEHRTEVFTGWLLVFSGAALLAGLLSGRISLHAHAHTHAIDRRTGLHRHFHMHWLHAGSHQHAHGSLATTLGALFALGGVRSLLAIVPIALGQTLLVSALRTGAFVAGIIAAMVSYGLVVQQVMSSSRWPRLASASSYVAAFFCLGAGALVLTGRI